MNRKNSNDLNMAEPTFDCNGYPTDETMHIITNWDYHDVAGWLDYIRAAWNHNQGRIWQEGGFLKLATGGWSGNESIIAAMQENYMLWSLLWESSHRGGLKVLRLTKPDES